MREKAAITPTATDALAITGDIDLKSDSITFADGTSLRLTPVGKRVSFWTPLLQGNTLCGWPVTFIIASLPAPNHLGLSVYYGRHMPRHFGDDSCAAYFYDRYPTPRP